MKLRPMRLGRMRYGRQTKWVVIFKQIERNNGRNIEFIHKDISG